MDRFTWRSTGRHAPPSRRPSSSTAHPATAAQPYRSVSRRESYRDSDYRGTSTTRVAPQRSRREARAEADAGVYDSRDRYDDAAWSARRSDVDHGHGGSTRNISSSTGGHALPAVPLDLAEGALRQQCETTRLLARLLAGVTLQWRQAMLDLDAARVPVRPPQLPASPSRRSSTSPRGHSAATRAGSASASASTSYLTEELHFDVHARDGARARGHHEGSYPVTPASASSTAHPYNRGRGAGAIHTQEVTQRVGSTSPENTRDEVNAWQGGGEATYRSWTHLTPAVQWISYVVEDDGDDGDDDLAAAGTHTRGRHAHDPFEDGALYTSLRRHAWQSGREALRHRSAFGSDGRRSCERLCAEREAAAADLDVQLRRSVLQGAARSAEAMIHGMRRVQETLKATSAAAAAATAAASAASARQSRRSSARRSRDARTPESPSSPTPASVAQRNEQRRRSHAAHTRQYAVTAPLNGVTAAVRAGGCIHPAPPARGRVHIYAHHEEAPRSPTQSPTRTTRAAPQTLGRGNSSAIAATSPSPARQTRVQDVPSAVHRKLDWRADLSGAETAAVNGAKSTPAATPTPPPASLVSVASPLSSLLQGVSDAQGDSSRAHSDSPMRRPLPPQTVVRHRSRLLATHAPAPTATTTSSPPQPALSSQASGVVRESEAEARLRLVMEYEDAFVDLLLRYHAQVDVKASRQPQPQQQQQQQRSRALAGREAHEVSSLAKVTTARAPSSPSAVSTLSVTSDASSAGGGGGAATHPSHALVSRGTRGVALQQLPPPPAMMSESASDPSRLPPRRLPARQTGAAAAAAMQHASRLASANGEGAVRRRRGVLMHLAASVPPLLSPLNESTADAVTQRSRVDTSSAGSGRSSSSSSSGGSGSRCASHSTSTSHGETDASVPHAEARERADTAALALAVPPTLPLLPAPAHAAVEAGAVEALGSAAVRQHAVATELFPTARADGESEGGGDVHTSHGAQRARPPLLSPSPPPRTASPAAVPTTEDAGAVSSHGTEVESFSSVSSFHESVTPVESTTQLDDAAVTAARGDDSVAGGSPGGSSPPPRNPATHGAGG